MKIKNRKVTQVGNSHYFRIDKADINNGNIKKQKEYDLDVQESKKSKEPQE